MVWMERTFLFRPLWTGWAQICLLSDPVKLEEKLSQLRDNIADIIKDHAGKLECKVNDNNVSIDALKKSIDFIFTETETRMLWDNGNIVLMNIYAYNSKAENDRLESSLFTLAVKTPKCSSFSGQGL